MTDTGLLINRGEHLQPKQFGKAYTSGRMCASNHFVAGSKRHKHRDLCAMRLIAVGEFSGQSAGTTVAMGVAASSTNSSSKRLAGDVTFPIYTFYVVRCNIGSSQ